MSIFNKHAHQERPYIVIVDIDGTISEATEDRLHFLPPPGKGALTEHWNEFNLACDTDAPITPVIGVASENGKNRTLSVRRCWNPAIQRRNGHAEVLGNVLGWHTAGQQLLG